MVKGVTYTREATKQEKKISTKKRLCFSGKDWREPQGWKVINDHLFQSSFSFL